MPAKIVYGKKKSQPSTSTNFTKLLSPEKAIATILEDNALSAAGQNWRRQLELAAQSTPLDDGDTHSTDVEGLERSLGALGIEGKTDDANLAGKVQRKNSKSRKARGKKTDGAESKEAAALIEESLEKRMGKLALGGKKEDGGRDEEEINGVDAKKKKKKKVGMLRKALEVRDANTVKELDIEGDARSKGKKRTGRSKERRRKEEMKQEASTNADVQTAYTSNPTPQIDVRVRTPRQTPKKSPKPKRRVECTPTTRPQPPQLLTPEHSPKPEDIYTAYVSPLLSLSDRKSLLPFDAWAAELEPHFAIAKIAEASFSEVYRLSSTSPNIKAESVLKVVALKTPPSCPFPCQLSARAIRDRDAQLQKEQDERSEKDQYKSQVSDILSEVQLLQNLTPIPGFTVFRSLSVLRGRPASSPAFTSAWHAWNRSRPRGKKSEFPDPVKKSSYDDTQLWAVIEMQDAGTDVEKLMEAGGLKSVWEVWDVFWGVACSVAKAEEGVRFEHRDLHLGNICVRSVNANSRTVTSTGTSTDADLMEPRITNPLKRKMRFSGLETTVIDYTLSRADIIVNDSSAESSPGKKSEVWEETDIAYMDLDIDPALFEGDASQEYQYEIYRYMRGAALFGNPLQSEPARLRNAEPDPEPEHGNEQGAEVAPLTPRRSPRKNTHIRFYGSDSDNDTIRVQPRRSPRKSILNTPETPESEAQPDPPQQRSQNPLNTNTNTNTNVDKTPWRDFHPQTNLVWLHFLLHKLLSHLNAHNAIPSRLTPEQLSAPVVVTAAAPDEPLDHDRIKRKAGKLYKVLERVSELLCPVALGREGALESGKELVVRALEERWLGVRDVEG